MKLKIGDNLNEKFTIIDNNRYSNQQRIEGSKTSMMPKMAQYTPNGNMYNRLLNVRRSQTVNHDSVVCLCLLVYTPVYSFFWW